MILNKLFAEIGEGNPLQIGPISHTSALACRLAVFFGAASSASRANSAYFLASAVKSTE